jgi:threonine/homoserine/homoserine lactone efflux protein
MRASITGSLKLQPPEMDLLIILAIAFSFSFVGSIPPGTLNISVLQLGLARKMDLAFRFSLAAAIVEYPYGWLAIKFEELVTSSPLVQKNLTLISASTMIVLGVANIWSSRKPIRIFQTLQSSGFRRGLILSVLNPMALPFWIGITAYLKSVGWVTLTTNAEIHSYLLGISLGAFSLLIVVAMLANLYLSQFQHSAIKSLPGIFLTALGIITLLRCLY